MKKTLYSLITFLIFCVSYFYSSKMFDLAKRTYGQGVNLYIPIFLSMLSLVCLGYSVFNLLISECKFSINKKVLYIILVLLILYKIYFILIYIGIVPVSMSLLFQSLNKTNDISSLFLGSLIALLHNSKD